MITENESSRCVILRGWDSTRTETKVEFHSTQISERHMAPIPDKPADVAAQQPKIAAGTSLLPSPCSMSPGSTAILNARISLSKT
jgi:hypothetical protein